MTIPGTEVLPRTDVPANFDQQMRMAEVLAQSNLLPSHLRKQPANVLVVLAGARALNIPAFWALQSLHVIEGKLGMDATLMRALVVGAGHQFRVIERSEKRAVVEIKRKDRDEPYRAEFSLDDAKRAELLGPKKENWRKYPKSMMVARATSIAVRDECAEVLFGVLYTAEELGADTDDDGTPVQSARVIDMPTPDAIERLAADLETWHPGVWADIVDRGWALEKIPNTDTSLLDRAVTTLTEAANAAETQDQLRELWRSAAAADLLGYGHPEALGDVLLRRKAHFDAADAAFAAAEVNRQRELVDLRKSMDRAHEKATAAAPDPYSAAEIAKTPMTDRAKTMQTEAAASWGDTDAEENPDSPQ